MVTKLPVHGGAPADNLESEYFEKKIVRKRGFRNSNLTLPDLANLTIHSLPGARGGYPNPVGGNQRLLKYLFRNRSKISPKFKRITLVGSNQGNYFENATVCSKGTLKTIVATWLYYLNASLWISHVTGHPVGEGEYDAVDVVLEDVGLDTSNRSIHAKTINDSTNIIGARAKQLVRKSFFTFKRNSS